MSPSPPARVLLALISVYRAIPKSTVRCRFEPTCSAYARDAVTLHGAIRGSWLALRRIGRCHPWGPTGFDPVPVPAPTSVDEAVDTDPQTRSAA